MEDRDRTLEEKIAFDKAIICGVEFLSAISNMNGAKEGQTLFTNMTEFLGAEFSDSVWMRLFGGASYGTLFHVSLASGYAYNINHINLIKIIRQYEDLGLKESKDIADRIKYGETVELRAKTISQTETYIREIKNLGSGLIIK